jgi:hypothetical protein
MELVRNDLIVDENVPYTKNIDVDIRDIEQGSIQIDTVDKTPAAKTFAPADIEVATCIVTEANHGFVTGLKVGMTSATTLPAGIAATAYVIKVDDDSYKLAASLADALAGTPFTITDQGTGNHTTTPAALASTTVTVAIQASNDGVTYKAYASNIVTATITGTSTELKDMTDKLHYAYLRVVITCAAGLLGLKVRLFGKRYR